MDTLRKIVDYCHSKKFLVTIHTSNELRSREAIACGVDSLAHPVIQSPVTDEFLWLLSHKRIPVVSTLTIGDRYSRIAEHPEYLEEKSYRDCYSESELAYLKIEESEKQKKNRWAMWMKVMIPVAQENLKRLQAEGGIISTGTDLTSGPDYQRELELLQESGISPFDVVVAATYNGAIFLSKESELGSITQGKLADLVLLDEDPTKDVRNIKSVSSVVKNGEVIDKTKLDLPVNNRVHASE
jgi:imidazolonepropionase-like amidohydrolase